MKITFHLSGGVRLDRRIEIEDMVFFQSISAGWYNLSHTVEPLDASNEIDESAAADALAKQYLRSGVKISWPVTQERLYEFDLRQIVWRAAAA